MIFFAQKLQVMEITKDEMRKLMWEQKVETLKNNHDLILEYLDTYKNNLVTSCDLMNDEIRIIVCNQKSQISMWNAFTHLTTSLPFRGSLGRSLKFFVVCGDHILGMVNMRSAPSQCGLRDKYLGWSHADKWKSYKMNTIFDMGVCVSTRRYADFLTGKLLVYVAFSNEVANQLKIKYTRRQVSFDLEGVGIKDDKILGYMVTSLYGKSSIYNRIPFLKYLGKSKGFSGIYLSDNEWQKVKKEFMKAFPRKALPLKFQTIDRLAIHYKKQGKEFPYEFRNTAWQRGVYFGHLKDAGKSLIEMVEDWRTRWFVKRVANIDYDSKETIKNELHRIDELALLHYEHSGMFF